MNTRLQVEHPITEMVTGLDLAKLQIRIAAGEVLPFAQAELTQRGHAIEARVYAEDPSNSFLPAIGSILRSVEPAGPGVRVDAGVETGDEVTIYYDPMIAKVVVLAENRDEAIRRMDQTLGQYVILGVRHNIAFLRDVLAHPVFREGQATTHFIGNHMEGWQPAQGDVADAALIVAALHEMTSLQGQRAGVGGSDDGDAFSPWGRGDAFRMGRG
jgi:acetyl/propionyl-CoA carboxylase alpha subunit